MSEDWVLDDFHEYLLNDTQTLLVNAIHYEKDPIDIWIEKLPILSETTLQKI